jgi:hypothetical protein
MEMARQNSMSEEQNSRSQFFLNSVKRELPFHLILSDQGFACHIESRICFFDPNHFIKARFGCTPVYQRRDISLIKWSLDQQACIIFNGQSFSAVAIHKELVIAVSPEAIVYR